MAERDAKDRVSHLDASPIRAHTDPRALYFRPDGSRMSFFAHRDQTVQFAAQPDFDYEIRCIIGAAHEGAAVIGEVLAATASIRPHDHARWYEVWRELAERSSRSAAKTHQEGGLASAADAYLRASAYFGVAVNALSALDRPGDLLRTFRAQRAAWQAFVACVDVESEHARIAIDSGEVAGWLFRSPANAATEKRHTLVVVNGSDGSLASVWASAAAPALRRGLDVLVFDGPGQQSDLFERGGRFRPDWEHVLTPIYDWLAAKEDRDPSRVALMGISQGGHWVARALAFEHRFAAAVLDPGVVDVAASWEQHIPRSLLAAFERGDDDRFDQEIAIGMKFSPTTARTWSFRARPYGTQGYAATLRAVRQYSVADVAAQIRTPMLIASPEGEQFWPGQSERLAALAPSVSTLLPFTAEEGAGGHCEPLARPLFAERAFSWLDEQLAQAGSGVNAR